MTELKPTMITLKQGLYLLVTASSCLNPGSCLNLPTSFPSSLSEKSSLSICRREFLMKPPLGVASVALVSGSRPASASLNSHQRSRSDGYAVQKSDSQWHSILSPKQFFILREGGTERPYSSILESEDRPGVFSCAGCGTDLFESSHKFHSGTGWPSFAEGLPGVEIEQVRPIQERLLGAELRCKTCGGHLGDVFNDGYLFVGTPAFATGKRFCIDGGALVFHSQLNGESVRGDISKPDTMPQWLQPPEIKALS